MAYLATHTTDMFTQTQEGYGALIEDAISSDRSIWSPSHVHASMATAVAT